MRTFPNFAATVESMLPPTAAGSGNESLEVRLIVDEAYSKLNKAMWECLNFIAKDEPGSTSTSAGHGGHGHHHSMGGTASAAHNHTLASSAADPEDKETLNYHILLIENMNHYLEEVDSRSNLILKEWRTRAAEDLASHLAQYTDAVMRRPLGKWLDFVEGTEVMLNALNNNNNNNNHTTSSSSSAVEGAAAAAGSSSIALRPSHSRSTAKKILASYDSKEIRKGVETLKKRIEKHFGDGDDPALARSLVGKVFGECAARYGHAWERMRAVLERVYGHGAGAAAGAGAGGEGSAAGLEIEWRKEEVGALFRR